MDEIGALIISAEEPQVEQCVAAVNNQTIPFSSIVHIENVVPESVAFNSGIRLATDKWVVKINGDMILYENAMETIVANMLPIDNVFVYNYMLFDEFIKAPIYGCSVMLRSAFQKVRYPNMITNDVYTGKKIQKSGMKKVSPEGVIIGTHCLNPDDFQVFRRFYSFGVKHSKVRRPMKHRLQHLYNETNNLQYLLAVESLNLGSFKRTYPGSHNIEFDRKIYNEFIKGRV